MLASVEPGEHARDWVLTGQKDRIERNEPTSRGEALCGELEHLLRRRVVDVMKDSLQHDKVERAVDRITHVPGRSCVKLDVGELTVRVIDIRTVRLNTDVVELLDVSITSPERSRSASDVEHAQRSAAQFGIELSPQPTTRTRTVDKSLEHRID